MSAYRMVITGGMMKAKSKAIQELINFIYESPALFKANKFYGFESDRFRICFTGNTRVLSIVTLDIDGKDFPLTYSDKWALEVASLWWFSNVPAEEYA